MESPNGKPTGLAATQVGIQLCIFLIQISEEAKIVRKDFYDTLPLTVWINWSYKAIKEEGKTKDWEDCYIQYQKNG